MSDTWEKTADLDWLRSFEVYNFRRDLILRHFKIKKGMKVLEAGSGPAHDSITFAEKGAEVHALDISKNALKLAQKFYKDLGLNLVTTKADLRKLPYPDNHFDFVWNAGTLEHFNDEDLKKIFSEMVRVAKKGGIVLALVPNKFYLWYQISIRRSENNQHHRQYDYERAFSTFEMRRLFREFNLKKVSSTGDFVYPKPGIISKKISLLDQPLRILFTPLERSTGLKNLKSIIALESATWGIKQSK